MNKNLISIFLLVFLISITSATLQVGNLSHQLTTSYAPTQDIEGWINISITNEPANSLFNDSLGNSISLLNLLKTSSNSKATYNCNTADCSSSYITSTPTTEKEFTLTAGQSKTIGILFSQGIINNIDEIKFVLNSDATSDCLNQIEIDILENSETDFINNKVLGLGCYLESSSCFDKSKTSSEITVDSTPFCQEFTLTQLPGFKVGAWIKKVSSLGSEKIKFELRNQYGETLEGANCEVPLTEITEGKVSCTINYPVTKVENYYICFYKQGSGGTYKTKGYLLTENPCAMHQSPPGQKSAAYNIFYQAQKFASVRTINITDELPTQTTFSALATNYIREKYNYDCTQGCVIPIKFTANKDQTIVIKNLTMEYSTSLGAISDDKFYELTKTDPTITANFQKIFLDKANFTTPSTYGNYTFILNYNNNEIISQKVLIEKVPLIKSLTPTTTAVAYPTTFTAFVEKADNSTNITTYQWDFGDGAKLETATNQVTHTYENISSYTLTLTVTDSKKLSSFKSFNIFTESPQKAINSTIVQKKKYLTEINNQLKNYTSFQQSTLKTNLALEEIGKSLGDAERKYTQATTDEQYIEIMKELLAIKTPKKISTSTKTDNTALYFSQLNIDLEILESIGTGSYSEANSQDYNDAITTWNSDNINTKINFNQLKIEYDNSKEETLSFFDITIDNKNGNAFFVMRKIADLEFLSTTKNNEEESYAFVELSKGKNTIQFTSSEQITFSELEYFISPSIKSLLITTPDTNDEEKNSRWTLFALIIILIIILGVVSYIVLQQWYKNKYESYLFKNKNDLYNLITYVQNSKKKKLTESQIRNNLKKSKWSGEQIDYVIKKYLGKQTGMAELPINKLLNKIFKKPEQEINKNNGLSYRRFP